MACKKSDLANAINAFANARLVQDATLVSMAGNLLTELIETLEFAPEEEQAFPQEQSEQE